MIYFAKLIFAVSPVVLWFLLSATILCGITSPSEAGLAASIAVILLLFFKLKIVLNNYLHNIFYFGLGFLTAFTVYFIVSHFADRILNS